MSIIEEASKRLQQLGNAGIQPPGKPGHAVGGKDEGPATPDPIPQQVSRLAETRHSAHASSGARQHGRTEPSWSDGAAAGPNFRQLDFGRLQTNGVINPTLPDSQLLHEFRVVKRPLIRNALGKSASPIANANLIMVTSALPGEGKTFVSLNLAMSIAMEVDSTVLLVDADVIAPSIPRLLGIQPAKGLMDVLTEPDLDLGDVLIKTNVERLSLVLAGTKHRRASELLASDAMASLLNEVANRYHDRIVVFDSPPLLATTESRVLASHMGQVVVVVEAERTTHGALETALATVESCPVVMTMLNKASTSDAGSYYGYYAYGH
jgi:protein-tyrosine kinase